MKTVKLSVDKYHIRGEIVDWCRSNISKKYGFRIPNRVLWGDDWGTTSDGYGNTQWHFIDERDAVMFVLRWA